jgi:hypothetical protein
MAALTEHLGPHVAAAVLEALPPYDWHSLATKDDLRALEHQMTARFAAVDARFSAVDLRFDAMDARFDAVDLRFDAMEARFTVVDARFDALDTKLDSRIDAAESRLTATMRAEMNRQLRWMVGSIVAILAAAGGIATAVSALT